MLRMAIAPGDRVELVATDDPYTNLQPGARGTVTGIRDDPERTIDTAWDNGSTLSILPDAGDRIRKLLHDHGYIAPRSEPTPTHPEEAHADQSTIPARPH
jgi:hypothetical protein